MSWIDELPTPRNAAEKMLTELLVGRYQARKGLAVIPANVPGITAISIPLLPGSLFLNENKEGRGTQLRLLCDPRKKQIVASITMESHLFSHFTSHTNWYILSVQLQQLKIEQLEQVISRIPTLEEEGRLWKDLLGLDQLVSTRHALPMDFKPTLFKAPASTRVVARREELQAWGLAPEEDGDFMLMALGIAMPAPERGFIVENTENGPVLRSYSRLINPVVHLGTRGY